MLVFALVSMVLALVSGARRSGGAAGTR
jgi:hypothetical protein